MIYLGEDKKKKLKVMLKFIFIFGLVSSLFFTQSLQGKASPANSNEREQLNNAINNLFQNEKQIITTKPAVSSTSYTSNFMWSSDQTLHGTFSSNSLYFSIPKYWDSKYALIEVNYTVSELINGIPAAITFSVNDKPFYSCAIKYVNDKENTMYAVIPVNSLKEGYNRLDISGYIRLDDEKGCSDEYSNANWINITKSSEVMIGYEVKSHNNKISSYPYPFMSTLDPTGSKTGIFVSDKGDNGEVSAAMLLSGKLGGQTSKENKLTVANWKEHTNIKMSNSIFIGLTPNIPEELKSYFESYKEQLTDGGVILFVNDSEGKPMILIGSDSEDGLMEAACMLNDENRVSQEDSSVVIIKNGSMQKVKDSEALKNRKNDTYKMEDIQGGGLTFLGPFHQSKEIYLPVSNDYILSYASNVSLKFRYSENLNFTRSLITVYWDDIPIASKKLTKENSMEDELSFMLPLDVAGSGIKKMKIAFDLELEDMECTKREMNMPWAYVTKDSEFYLPLQDSIVAQFDTMPVPFKKNGTYNKLLFVLPDNPTRQEFSILGKILAIYSSNSNPYGEFKVCHSKEFFEDKNNNYKNMNIITIGTRENNALIEALNENMYFKYNDEGTKFVSNDKLIISDNYASNIGTMQLLKSPYGDKFSILVVTAPKLEAIGYINEFVSNEEYRSKFKNDCIIINNNLEIKSYRFQEKEVEKAKPTVIDQIFENKEYTMFTLTATSVMFILFLSIVLILVRNRTRNQSQDRAKGEPRNSAKNKSKDDAKNQNNTEMKNQAKNKSKTDEMKDENIVGMTNESINKNDTEIKRETRTQRRMRLKTKNRKSHDE